MTDNMMGRTPRWGVLGRSVLTALGLAMGVTACGAVLDGPKTVQKLVERPTRTSVDLALGAMARGDYGSAEQYFKDAMAREAPDPYALFGAAALYENTGRPQRAIEAYERLLALHPQGTVVTGPWAELEPRLLRDVARDNLRALRRDVRERQARQADARPSAVPDMVLPLGVVGSAEETEPAWGDAPELAADAAREAARQAAGGLDPSAQRFVLLRRLRDAGLITGAEYRKRRAANVGALLPMTERPPASGLSRPAPSSEEVISRLRQLRTAFERRAVTARQHAVERGVILDALLPDAPENRAPEARLPEDVIAAADALGRLERLREADLVTAAEYREERAALRAGLRAAGRLPGQGPTPRSGAHGAAESHAAPTEVPRPAEKPTMLVPSPEPSRNPAAVVKSGETPVQVVPDPPSFARGDVPAPEEGGGGIAAVHLASFKTEDAALKGWAELTAAHPVLRGLEPRITVIRLPEKGAFHRLNAGPLASRAAARKVCDDLGNQYCKPVFLGG